MQRIKLVNGTYINNISSITQIGDILTIQIGGNQNIDTVRTTLFGNTSNLETIEIQGESVDTDSDETEYITQGYYQRFTKPISLMVDEESVTKNLIAKIKERNSIEQDVIDLQLALADIMDLLIGDDE